MRVALDSSVLIAAFLSRAGVCAELYEDVLEHHQLVVSDYILGEVERKLRTKFLIRADLVRRTINSIIAAAEVVDPLPVPPDVCRDPGDLPILGTAVAGRAAILVTVDKDLLDMEVFGTIAIMRPGEFWSRSSRPTGR